MTCKRSYPAPCRDMGLTPLSNSKEEHLQLSQQIGVRPKAIADKPFQTRQPCLTISLPFQDEEVFGYLAAQYKQAQIGVQDQLAVCTWNANVGHLPSPPDLKFG